LRHYGLIGYPLGHSFSVTYFKEKFTREGIQAQYRNYPLKDLSAFADLVKSDRDLAGLNVTVPHKQEILSHLQALSGTAKDIGAVNTISVRHTGEDIHLTGDNTDAAGFRRSLEEHLEGHHDSALVLGAGGSSRAVCFVLGQMEIPFVLVSRSSGEQRISYEQLEADRVAETPLIINTTPLGMYPAIEACPLIPYEKLTPRHLLFDLVYNPPLTRFLTRGKERGAATVNGYDMLVYQAEASWKIWNKA
jgi:shikimate dehydrogenase